MYDYGDRYGGAGKFRNPYFITNYANALYRDYLLTDCADESLHKQFMIHAKYLLDSKVMRGALAEWPYPFPVEDYGIPGGWISGIGQARIAGVLERAFALTAERAYHEAAEAAMETYLATPIDGGVSTIDGDVIWVEEYADPTGTSYKVLNGHITALGGILDYHEITGEDKWKDVFVRGVAAVKRDIAKFDAGFLSLYSLFSPKGTKYAPRKNYNSLHVEQLLWLYETTGDPDFLLAASRFQYYEVAPYVYSAKGAVDPVKHGPDGADGRYGSRYWSHADFPTWLQIDVPKMQYSAVAVHGNGDKAVPRDFTVSAATDDGWTVVHTVTGNSAKHYLAEFEAIQTTAFRLDIQNDNGNKNVAMQALLPIPAEPQYAAVPNACNYRIKAGRYNYDLALDDDLDAAMRVFCAGWMVLPLNGARTISVLARSAEVESMILSVSDDLVHWREVGEIQVRGEPSPLPVAKFARVGFSDNFAAIERVSVY